MIKEEKTKEIAPESTQQMSRPLPKVDSEDIARKTAAKRSLRRTSRQWMSCSPECAIRE
jgi:hypothetical protein